MDPADLRQRVAFNVRRLCAERGMSLTRLADFSGVSRPALSRALAGNESITLDRLAKVAEALEVDPVVLLAPADRISE